MANQSETIYVIEEREIWHDCDTATTHNETVRDVATRRPMVEYLASVALVEDKGTESCTEYVVYRQPSNDCDSLRVVRISGFSGGFKLELEEEGELIDSARFDDDNCDKVDLAIKIINVLDGEEDDEED